MHGGAHRAQVRVAQLGGQGTVSSVGVVSRSTGGGDVCRHAGASRPYLRGDRSTGLRPARRPEDQRGG
eukprot:scaffold74249_cov69-Phaeocystis_antarctica.AAC.2